MSGQLIETTAEHPFWVVGRGWTPVCELSKDDSLTTITGETVSVEGVHETDRRQTVYNLRVAEFHTYFVGCDDWGFSVWAHNTGGCVVWVVLGGKAEEFATLPKAKQDALNAIADHINVGNVNAARQALQGQGLSGKKAGDVIDTLQNPPVKGTPDAAGPATPTPRPPSPALEMARHSVEDSGTGTVALTSSSKEV
ncbi:polymorphic toxin-type HINT domain-containing protein [Tuwongella immobilis]|uniref:Intein C-terminal splicing domain-containing protein n=1 Tax=Tuwongella immobilis TaxID=692036 RepID=A0A6C2YIG3_9BACT|nr:polymorphic toxin-type HINT domain-containing protein [Tuwongella immobilis]VIP00782.1 YD repeat protein OS=Isosphaera pallida (strain ATCC 43644 / DSM 9630 / IS1B) GN=Isop_2419 PE=4 SV=1: PT-HINT [Tuwongella immobilis]VTR96982.1 YD repeat protein OS=Isosphaera pallida (strain ATCC 43644 / DSM 9630 / IS1B) GN=Isop_2419 PE=4 SV=1: PT-HINT [Tuwongella immobilis]